MRAYETQVRLKPVSDNVGLLEYFSRSIKKQVDPSAHPVRFAVSRSGSDGYDIELGLFEEWDGPFASIFEFSKRQVENIDSFNAVMLVPTGIGASIGGHAGDAAPAARVLASVCDTLITHPNVVNASDINEISENTLYVEGSVICRLMMGTVGLQRVRSNRILTVIEKHPTDELFVNAAVNSVNAAQAAAGFRSDSILIIDPAMRLIAEKSPSGRAIGRVEGLDYLMRSLRERESEFDNVAITSIVKIPSRQLHYDYFHSDDEMVNPWGGVEAIFTHVVSSALNIQAAHSPMLEDQLIANMDVGVVDPRKAAEAVSFTYLHSVLKGLHKAPRIITDKSEFHHSNVVTASDISCLVIPDGCIGLPTLAALEQGIQVIAVKGNKNIMQNDLESLPWSSGQFRYAENYFEAAGMLSAIREGISLTSVDRPMRLAADTSHSTESPTLVSDGEYRKAVN